jgi:transcriptional regulator with XRE-family HTH domain
VAGSGRGNRSTNAEASPMTSYDGPTLRAIRESMGVPLRRVARQAGMSHGHLSKVERGEHGRPITPAILAAYEKVTGVSLADAAAALAEHREGVIGRRGNTWQPGQLTDMRRLAFNAALGAKPSHTAHHHRTVRRAGVHLSSPPSRDRAACSAHAGVSSPTTCLTFPSQVMFDGLA